MEEDLEEAAGVGGMAELINKSARPWELPKPRRKARGQAQVAACEEDRWRSLVVGMRGRGKWGRGQRAR